MQTYKKLKISLAFEIFPALNTNEILSSSVKRENRLKLCQATWTTHSHSEQFNKNVEKLCEFYPIFIVVFAQKSDRQFSKIIRVYF